MKEYMLIIAAGIVSAFESDGAAFPKAKDKACILIDLWGHVRSMMDINEIDLIRTKEGKVTVIIGNYGFNVVDRLKELGLPVCTCGGLMDEDSEEYQNLGCHFNCM